MAWLGNGGGDAEGQPMADSIEACTYLTVIHSAKEFESKEVKE